jgi:hypothetical protein
VPPGAGGRVRPSPLTEAAIEEVGTTHPYQVPNRRAEPLPRPFHAPSSLPCACCYAQTHPTPRPPAWRQGLATRTGLLAQFLEDASGAAADVAPVHVRPDTSGGASGVSTAAVPAEPFLLAMQARAGRGACRGEAGGEEGAEVGRGCLGAPHPPTLAQRRLWQAAM